MSILEFGRYFPNGPSWEWTDFPPNHHYIRIHRVHFGWVCLAFLKQYSWSQFYNFFHGHLWKRWERGICSRESQWEQWQALDHPASWDRAGRLWISETFLLKPAKISRAWSLTLTGFPDLLEDQKKGDFYLPLKKFIVTDGKKSDGRCSKKQRGVSSQEKPAVSKRTLGAFRRALLLDLGWEEISHKKGRGKREIQVWICYSPSLKGHCFSESRSCLSRKSPAPAGSFFTALWKCLAVLSFSTHSPETAVLLYLCTREQSSSRLWVLHSWTLWSLLPSGGAYVVPGRAHHPGMLLTTYRSPSIKPFLLSSS